MKSSASPFRLDDREPLAGGLRRIFCAQLDNALWQIRERPEHRNTVQNVRRVVKKLRAILRLLRDAIAEEVRTREDDRLREAARCISGLRDAQMRLKTVEKLARNFSGRRSAFVNTRRALKGELAKLSTSAADSLREAACALEAERAQVDDWFPAEVKWRQIRSGLRFIYKDGRVSFRKAVASRSVESMHVWRKRVKDLWYHLQLLANVGSRAVKKLARESKTLSELIGEVHDLDVLRASVIQHEASDERDALVSLLDSRRSKLVRAAIDLGKGLYAEKPEYFAARVCK